MARYGVNQAVRTRLPGMQFPLGTAAINVVGCFVIGLLAGLLVSERIALRAHWREFVFVGLLGGFTTFSAFGLETLTLSRTAPAQAAINVAIQVVGGLAAAWVGYQVGSAGS